MPDSYAYVVSAQKPTCTTHAFVGNFTAPDDVNLIVARSTRLEIHKLTEEGLDTMFSVDIYGRIATMNLFKPKGASTHSIFLSTEKYVFCVLEFNAERQELVSVAKGSARNPLARPVEGGPISVIDPAANYIVMHLYDGLLKVIRMNEGKFLSANKSVTLPLDETTVLDMTWCGPPEDPLLVLLTEDPSLTRKVVTYRLAEEGPSLMRGPWGSKEVEKGATKVIPVGSKQAVLVIGEQSVTYLDESNEVKTPTTPLYCVATGPIDTDGSRHLIGDVDGGLHCIQIRRNGSGGVSELAIERLGRTSTASSICYLDNGYVYIGSFHGDSQLIKLSEDVLESGDYIEVVDTFENLGPIVDMCVMDMGKQGNSQIVTCSGAGHCGSLRIVRNGIQIEEQAVVDLEGITGLWNLRGNFESEFDKFLVHSYISSTRVFEISEEELDEITLPGFDHDAQTLLATTMSGNHLLQVTAKGARLVSADTKELVTQWNPPGDGSITVAAGNATQVVCAAGKQLFYLELVSGALNLVKSLDMPHDVSCLTVHPLVTESSESADTDMTGSEDKGSEGSIRARQPVRSPIVAVGLWTDISVRLLSLPDLNEVGKEQLGGEVQSRSVCLGTLENAHYLFVAMADGSLYTYSIDPSTFALSNKKRVNLGTEPVTLTPLFIHDRFCIFASCDHPTVIHSSGRLTYNGVNMTDVAVMSPFHSEAFPDCFALASRSTLTIGTADDIQKLHYFTMPLGEQPRKIVHHPSSHAIVVATVGSEAVASGSGGAGGGEGENEEGKFGALGGTAGDGRRAYLRVLDDGAFDMVSSYTLDPCEDPMALLSCTLNGKPYIVLGTSYVLDDEEEPTKGRIIVFSVGEEEDRKLDQVAALHTVGGVLSLATLPDRIAAGVMSNVHLYSLSASKEGSSEGAAELKLESSHAGFVMSLYMASKGDVLVVGDMMKSVCMYSYIAEDGKLSRLAYDPNATWMTSVTMLDKNTVLGSDNGRNLFLRSRDLEATNEEARKLMRPTGDFHLGDQVNSFCEGSLVMIPDGDAGDTSMDDDADPLKLVKPALLYGTVSGVIGAILTLPKPLYKLLLRLQRALSTVVGSVGGFTHSEWRARNVDDIGPAGITPVGVSEAFIDGDLVETFLELDAARAKEVVEALNKDGEGTIAAGQSASSDSAGGSSGGGGAGAGAGAGAGGQSKEAPSDVSYQTYFESSVYDGELTVAKIQDVVEELSKMH